MWAIMSQFLSIDGSSAWGENRGMRDKFWQKQFLRWNDPAFSKSAKLKIRAKRKGRPIIAVSREDHIALGDKSVREKCVALRDRYTATAIGNALGISRNAVIGHWFRDRHA